MTYSTPGSLLNAGQGVSSVYFFFLGALDSAEALIDNPETPDNTTGPEASISLFLASSCGSSSVFFLSSCSKCHIPPSTSDLWYCTQLLILSLSL